MQETANKQKRMTLKTLHEMLNGRSVELAVELNLRLFSLNRNVKMINEGLVLRGIGPCFIGIGLMGLIVMVKLCLRKW